MKSKSKWEFLIIVCLFSVQSLFAQDAYFEWARQMGGIGGNIYSRSITLDSSGNIYTTGWFSGTIDFDPGPDSALITVPISPQKACFVQKLDNNGNFLWVKQMAGVGKCFSNEIATDSNGNIYITGNFLGTVDFDPGEDSLMLTPAGDFDIFIQKLDSNGNVLWAKQMGGGGPDNGSSIAIDNAGNIYSTGYFGWDAYFNPEAGTGYLNSAGLSDVFVQKLDANGNFQWVKRIGGADWDRAASIALDALGNIYITGRFSETVDFDPGSDSTMLTSFGSSDVFVQKLDNNGNFLWVKQMGGIASTIDVTSITIDSFGNIYTTGWFNYTIDFDPGADSAMFTSYVLPDIYVQKLDNSGNFQWVKQMEGNWSGESNEITIDASGNVYTVGEFKGTADFDPGEETVLLASNGGDDAFVQKLDSNGNFQWVKQLGGDASDLIESIVLDAAGNIYTTGRFQWLIDMDPNEEVANFTSIGNADTFIHKLSQSVTLGISEIEQAIDLLVYPNPSTRIYTIQFVKTMEYANLSITDIHGRLISTKEIRNTSTLSMEINEVPGIYLLRINTKDSQRAVKLIKE